MYRLRLLLLHILALVAQPWLRRPSGSIQRVLYIKPDHLGDLLLATPVLAALRVGLPEAQITALVGPWSRMMLERNPNVDILQICPFPGFERQARPTGLARLHGYLLPYVTLVRYAMLLRAGGYDLAIIGRDDHWWGAALALLAGVPQRVGFAVPECAPFLSKALPWNSKEHVTAQGLQLVEVVTGIQPPANLAARFTPTQSDHAWATAWREEQGQADAPLVIIHPGTGGATKHWLDERWSAVGDALTQTGALVLITGGPGEETRVEHVARGMTIPPSTLAGKTTVGQLAALMAQTVLVLGVDSGPLHLAAATGTTTVHLYGPGDEARFGPWGDPKLHRVLHAELACRPCGVFNACPRGLVQPECMGRISTQPVIEAAKQVLQP